MNEAPKKPQIIRGLIEAATILELAASHIREDVSSDAVAANYARRARIQADTAFRKAIGAHCDECGGNTEQHTGNS